MEAWDEGPLSLPPKLQPPSSVPGPGRGRQAGTSLCLHWHRANAFKPGRVARRSSLFEDYSLVASKKESRLLRDHSHVLSLAPRRQPERPGRVTGSPVPRPRWMPAWSGTRRTAILSLGRRHRAPVSADGLPGPRTAPGRGHGPDAAHTVSTGHWANPAEGRSAGWARRP